MTPIDPREQAEWSRAQRASEEITLHILANNSDAWNRWAAIRLSDGSSDGKLYDTKSDAQRFQLHKNQCAYVCIPPGGMTPKQAKVYLRFMEQLYDAGADLADPDMQVQMPQTHDTKQRVVRAIRRGDVK